MPANSCNAAITRWPAPLGGRIQTLGNSLILRPPFVTVTARYAALLLVTDTVAKPRDSVLAVSLAVFWQTYGRRTPSA